MISETNSIDIEERYGIGVYASRGISLVRGEGAHVCDEEGRDYLDLTAAYGVASLGHCHPALVAAIREQAGNLISCQGSFANDQRALLLRELVEVLPAGMDRIFLCNSGTESIEGALKLARLATGKHEVVAAMRGFHGRTMGALGATWEPHYRTPFAPLLDGFSHVAYNNLAALDAAVTDEVGAVLLEVVQGEGGVRPGTAEFLLGAQRICRERGAMLILDEVQTGFGRTGRMFALEHYGLEPDMLCLAKALGGGFPMGALVLGPRVTGLSVGAHGSTFGGSPLACAAARASLATMRGEDLPQQSADKGAYLLERLRLIETRRLTEVRGIGLMIGIELREKAKPYITALQGRGLLVLAAGPNVIRLLPPLVIGYDDLDRAATIIEETIIAGVAA